MSLPRSPLAAKQRYIESNSSPAIETTHISHSPADVEKEDIPRLKSPSVPSGNSIEEARIDVDSFSPSSPANADTGSAVLDFASLPHPSDISFNSPRHPDRPYSPLASAVDSATDTREPLSLERPLILPKVDFSHQEPFGTSVRDFLEENNLAGYEIVAPRMPMIPLPDDNTLASKYREVPSIETTSLDQPPSYSLLPRLRTGAPAYELVNREIQPINQSTHESGSSAAMVTTTETQMFGRWSDESDFSFDGMSISMKSRNRATSNPDQTTTDYEEISPTSNVAPAAISDTILVDRRPSDEASDNELSNPDASITGRSSNVNSDRDNNAFVNSTPPMGTISESISSGANPGAESPVYHPVLPSHTTIPGVPRDITGELPSPGFQTPSQSNSKLGKRKRMLGGIQKFYRKVRTVLLRRRVLDIIIGRELGKPTRDGLRAISKGLPVNIVKVTVAEPDTQSIPS